MCIYILCLHINHNAILFLYFPVFAGGCDITPTIAALIMVTCD